MAYIGATVRFLQSVRYLLTAAPLTTGNSESNEDERSTLRLRLVLIGPSGTGKCSTANSLVEVASQRPVPTEISSGGIHRFKVIFQASRKPEHPVKVFETDAFGIRPATIRHGKCQKVTVEAAEFGLKDLQIVTTPGFKADLSEDGIAKELCNCLLMSLPGPHAFLLFVRIGHSDYKEVGRQMNAIKEIFGTGFINHTMVVFTGADVMKQDGIEIEELVEKLEGDEFKRFLKECNNRYVTFDNQIMWGSNKKLSLQDRLENIKQSQDLINSAIKIVDGNEGKHYSDALYETAGQIQEDHKDVDGTERMELLLASKDIKMIKGKVKHNDSCIIL